MGDKGSRDKGKREEQKKAQISLKEKRKLKKDKKDERIQVAWRAERPAVSTR